VPFLAILVQISHDPELEDMIFPDLRDIVIRDDGIARGCPSGRKDSSVEIGAIG
jgi:hypothetical protein